MVNLIETLSRSIAHKIKAVDPEGITASVNVMAYALGVYLNFFLTAALVALVGFFTHSFVMTIVSFVAFCVIRFFSGGFHFKSLTLCSFVTAALLAPIPHIELIRTYVLLLTIITGLIFLRYSPNMDEETTNMNPKYFQMSLSNPMCSPLPF
jgi:accessory gene regulator B